MAWHVYLALVLPGCHFLNIFASKVSLKNKGSVKLFWSVSQMTRVPLLPQVEYHCCIVHTMCGKPPPPPRHLPLPPGVSIQYIEGTAQ